ncbi:EAL and HDOD domain-containing protein [Actimicrobium sp. CCI2.3]|uniref:EAL and HDOD domain-containing protein n=1 Tax=Actimicrobium sp. CCI2.3 TaxID=3048616 RepID=UPI002AB46D98|nr:HDOD domain-containing protein [Actimicrobium sp. CCI2.3]MDY7575345.1 HDOD domain-containing protein [Actimicrobium sp. CCI2.3]MEB0021257.1 HDOD domain-containing protein [Actimicrobium sp. CCI2.3]
MQDVNFIVREPLLDPTLKVLGYALSWQGADGASFPVSEMDLQALAAFAGERFTHPERGYLMAGSMLFLTATPETLRSGVLASLSPDNTVLSIDRAFLDEESALDDIKFARSAGFGIMLCDADLGGQDKALLPLASHIEICFDSADFLAHTRLYASLKESSNHMVARGVRTWPDFQASSSLGMDAFVGNLFLSPRPGAIVGKLNPAQAMILQLMDMVRKNADVRLLEGVLKRDAGLSYKLLRYINSAGFGLGTEIQSLRHAVTMLGYSPLYRWLSVLLATAGSSNQSPVLMQTAIVRGRFAELLGQSFLPRAEAENLFVAGMFSLLDLLLGVPMEDVLDSIQLSEAVTQALLTREGIFGPFLALAEACEKDNGSAGPLAEALFISASQVNEAHMAALIWAQSLKL